MLRRPLPTHITKKLVARSQSAGEVLSLEAWSHVDDDGTLPLRRCGQFCFWIRSRPASLATPPRSAGSAAAHTLTFPFPLVAGPVCGQVGARDSWGRAGLPWGRLGPQKLLAGSAAGGECRQRAQSDARAEASGAAPAMSSNHLGVGALLGPTPTQQQVRLAKDHSPLACEGVQASTQEVALSSGSMWEGCWHRPTRQVPQLLPLFPPRLSLPAPLILAHFSLSPAHAQLPTGGCPSLSQQRMSAQGRWHSGSVNPSDS